jgi:neutrophil factor 2
VIKSHCVLVPEGPDIDVQPNALSRSKTTIGVPSDARERTVPSLRGTYPPAVSRSNTTTGRPTQADPPTRGLSIRKPGFEDGAPPAPPKPSTQKCLTRFVPNIPAHHLTGISPRMTEFYDNLVDSYADSPRTSPPGNERVANWARNAASSSAPPSRAPSAYGGSTRSGTLKRRVTRRTVAPSVYDEDGESFAGSGEWDEMYELTKIRVKIHFEGDVRGMALVPETPFAEFKKRVADKFETSPQSIILKFRDEDGGQVSLRDESDYEMAIETARESAKGKPEGKLEVWCEAK